MKDPNKNPFEIESIDSGVIIRFVRPEIRNPLSIRTLEMLAEELLEFEENPDISTIIFTGSGTTFAAGADLKEIAKLNGETAREFGLRGQNLMRGIYHSNKNMIAAVDGFCMGGALDLALACKSRIASPRSVFAHPGVNLGIITGWGGTQMLPRLIGESRALELVLTGRQIGADEALLFGLIDKIENNPVASSVSKLSESDL